MLVLFRIVLGFAQGVALHLSLLPSTYVAGTDPRAQLRQIAIACLVFVPTAVNLALPTLSIRRAALWALILTIMLGGLAFYNTWLARGGPPHPTLILLALFSVTHIYFDLVFIAQALLLASVRDERSIARYPTYFDVAWGQGVQIILGTAFSVLLYAIIWLGSEMFAAIGIDGLKNAVEHRWFVLPAITTGFAISINITELRVQLLRTSRSLFLTLAAWLLPVLTLLILCFLAALAVTGLTPLWATHRAGAILVAAAFVLVLLINAVYGDGTDHSVSGRPLRIAASLATWLLVPIVALAAYGLSRRIVQHGLTPARIFLAADIVIVSIYAVGYPLSLLRNRAWLRGLQNANIAAAYAVIALILLLWSPVLSPQRLSVADQMARLQDGRTKAASFDYNFLRFDAGWYGDAALHRLESGWTGPDAALVSAGAKTALAATYRVGPAMIEPPVTRAGRRAHITVYPAGAALPDSLLDTQFAGIEASNLPGCLRDARTGCEAFMLDILKQSRPQVLVVSGFSKILLAQNEPGGKWHVVADLFSPYCEAAMSALRAGTFTFAPNPLPVIQAGGVMLPFYPVQAETETCPPNR